MPTSGYSMSLLFTALGLAACDSAPVVSTDEVPLQPAAVCPSAFEDLGGSTGKGQKTP
ncbi:MAG: hypothetical protein HY083_04725 [Gammaproteobacteria bacterium]|nr:hypothetical protein [Gammaproteobacteria bacterium]